MNAFVLRFLLKGNLFLAFLLIYSESFSQLSDDFSDGDFTSDPVWSGNTELWQINEGALQSNSLESNVYYLSTPNTLSLNAEWEFFINLKFATSGVNYVDVYLSSDNNDLTAVQNGYFIRIGDTNDEIVLYKVDEGIESAILQNADGVVNSSSNNPFRFKVTRDNGGLWTLNYDDGDTGSFTEFGTIEDNDILTSSYFGILIKQSSAASPKMNHFFDDFKVQELGVDNSPPQLIGYEIISDRELHLSFSEPLAQGAAENVNSYAVSNDIGSPLSSQLNILDPTSVRLTFEQPFQNGIEYQLTINNLQDLNNNTITTVNETFLYFIAEPGAYKDVIINEIMADFSPANDLPEAEYIELYNNSDKIINLENWTFSDQSTDGVLGKYILFPDKYIMLCDASDKQFFVAYGNLIGLKNWPSLNNGGDMLVLKNKEGFVTDAVNYDDSWYKSSSKSDGGWSLELIDPSNACSGENNWAASENSMGGTPGTVNSVKSSKPDLMGPIVTEAIGLAPDSLVVVFNESLDPESLSISDFIIDNGIEVTDFEVLSDLKTVTLLVNPALQPQVIYTLTAQNLTDCNGNRIVENSQITFSLIQPAEAGDLIITELLFNPRADGVDFVEVYNRSSKYINLNGWFLANGGWLDDGDMDIIASKNLIIQPKAYIALTTDGLILKEQYPFSKADNFWETKALPTYPNDSGTVALLQPDSAVMDLFEYSEDLHFQLLASVEGVSLERVSFDASINNDNWKSAASTVGFATPGYVNSQLADDLSLSSTEIIIDPKIIIPDGSGKDDYTTIRYHFSQAGNVANIRVMDINGRTIKMIAENDYLSNSGFYTWNGLTEDGTKARLGYYLIYFEVFDLNGNSQAYKKKVVVGTKF